MTTSVLSSFVLLLKNKSFQNAGSIKRKLGFFFLKIHRKDETDGLKQKPKEVKLVHPQRICIGPFEANFFFFFFFLVCFGNVSKRSYQAAA